MAYEQDRFNGNFADNNANYLRDSDPTEGAAVGWVIVALLLAAIAGAVFFLSRPGDGTTVTPAAIEQTAPANELIPVDPLAPAADPIADPGAAAPVEMAPAAEAPAATGIAPVDELQQPAAPAE